MQLNTEQQRAVNQTEGYVRIIAGAGSGKTRVLVERIAHIIDTYKAYPNQILAITFTNKAARELKERLELRLSDGAGNRIVAATFHSLCVRILREKEQLLQLTKPFLILDPDDQKSLMKQLLKDVFGKDHDVKPQMAISKISDYKNSNMRPNEAEKYAYTDFEKKFVEVYRKYQAYLKSQALFDFDDLLLEAVKLFETNREAMQNIVNRYHYIHVDEFQDTNEVQSELLKYLAAGHQNLCVVGDPDQSIYSWRGARPKILLGFDKIYQNVETIYLSENYRSTQKILDAANDLISHNKTRLDNPLRAQTSGKFAPTYRFLSREDEEIQYIVEQIDGLVSDGYEYHDIAILYRANYISRYIETGLIRGGIPYQIFGNVQFYARAEIRDVMALLRLLVNSDDLSFERIIAHLTKGIGAKKIEEISLIAQSQSISYWEAFQIVKLSTKQQLERNRLVEAFAAVSTIDVQLEPQFYFQTLIEKVRIYDYLDDEVDTRRENIQELERVFCDFFFENDELSLKDFITEASLYSENDKSSQGGAVTLMTVHMAKGLEFPVVFLPAFVEGVFPSQKTMDEVIDGVEEERRLAYVAATRAKERLLMSGAKVGGYQYDFRLPSQFAREMDIEFIEAPRQYQSYAQTPSASSNQYQKYVNARLSTDKEVINANVKYTLGDSVEHTLFGRGTIVGIDGDLHRIAFVGKGIKVLKLPHQTVRKV